MAGRKQKPTKDLIMMRPGLRAQVPDSPSLSLASASSRRALHYTNAGYENADALSAGPDYEDLESYRQATGPRKQPNIIYESTSPTPIPPSPMPQHQRKRQLTECSDDSFISSPIPPSPMPHHMHRKRQFTECSDDSTSASSFDHYPHSKRTRGKDLILVFIMFISLVSLTLVVLMIFGVLGPKCSSCETTKGGRTERITKIQEPGVGNYKEEIMILKKNISILIVRDVSMMARLKTNEIMINRLKDQLKSLTNIDQESQLDKLQNMTNEVKALRSKQADFTSSLDDLKSKDKTKSTHLKELDHKVHGLSVNVTFLSLNDSLYKAKVSNLIQSDYKTKQELDALKRKDSELNSTVQVLKHSDTAFNDSLSGLKKFDEDVKATLSIMNSTVASKIKNITDMMNKLKQAGGKQGPPGPPGPQGPPGVNGASGSGTNFSRCVHKYTDATAAQGSSAKTLVRYIVEKGKVVTGVTCSTIGGDETNLETGLNKSNQTVYVCHCLGKSTSSAGKSNTNIKCRIDYWLCPLS